VTAIGTESAHTMIECSMHEVSWGNAITGLPDGGSLAARNFVACGNSQMIGRSAGPGLVHVDRHSARATPLKFLVGCCGDEGSNVFSQGGS